MIASRDQSQLPSSLAPLGDLLKALIFLSNLLNGKVLPSCGKKRALSDYVTISLSPSCFCFALLVCIVFFVFVLS